MLAPTMRAGIAPRQTLQMTLLLFALLAFTCVVQAQTTSFTYQGRLTDAGALANSTYDFQFSLFDNAGVQQGASLERLGVTVTDGSFVVTLDFGDVFDGTDRQPEIGVRPGGSPDPYTILAPRWPITSTPYAIRSLKAAASDTATTATTATTADTATTATTATDATQLGGVAADQYVKTDDPRLVNGLPPAPGSPNYIQNTTTPQASANFNVSGNGIIGGNVGIGANNPASKLDVRGHLLLDPGASPVLYTSSTGGEQNRFLQLINSPTTPSASGLKAGGLLVADSFSFANPSKNDLIVKGNTGIGLAAPQSKLHLAGSASFVAPFGGLFIDQTIPATAVSGSIPFQIRTTFRSGVQNVTRTDLLVNDVGNVGIGTATPTSKMEIAAQDGLAITGFQPFLTLRDTNGGNKSAFVQGVNGNVVLLTNNRAALVVRDGDGQVSVKILQITGGSDLSENFDVRGPAPPNAATRPAEIKPGLVVSIDPKHPGQLVVSHRAYDHSVAGIISGAGNVKPGMVMSHEGTLADGRHPVALSGRVYCLVDATRGAVKPGDLLTTSATPGHAMRVMNHARAQGAIIGKAMTGLKSGRGLVLVLVTLQ